MWGLPQKKNARRAYKIRLCGHLRRYKKIVKKTYIIYYNYYTTKKWGQLKNFDLTINSDLGIEKVADIIVELFQQGDK